MTKRLAIACGLLTLLISFGQVAAQVSTAHDCATCHDPQDSKNPAFLIVANSAELCSSCHDQGEGDNVHMPVADDCLSCHNPHNTASSGLLTVDVASELCSTCHDQAEGLGCGVCGPGQERQVTADPAGSPPSSAGDP